MLSDPAAAPGLDAGAQSDEAGILRHLAAWGRLVIAETFAPENAGLEGRTVGAVAAERGARPFDALLDDRGGRPSCAPGSPAHPRVRGRLGGPGRGVAGPTGGGGRLRRRGPPRHHVRRHLLHLPAGRRGAPTGAARLGGGRPAADRRAGPALRAASTGGGLPRAGSPTSWSSTPPPSGTVPVRTRERPARWGRAASMPRPTASRTSSSTGRRSSPTVTSPARCRAGSCARGRDTGTVLAGPPAGRPG